MAKQSEADTGAARYAAADAREARYAAVEARVRESFEAGLRERALAALTRCPRRSGLPAMGSYYCECPACTPEEWGLDG